MKTIIQSDWGPAMHRASCVSAAAGVWCYVVVADLIRLTYAAGAELRRAVDHRSQQLAALMAPTDGELESEPEVRSLRGDDLDHLSQRQLMALAGVRRRLPKATLIQMIRED